MRWSALISSNSRAAALLLFCVATAATSADSQLPAVLAPLASFVTLTPQEIDALTSGRAVTRAFGDEAGELRLFGAIWIDAGDRGALAATAASGTALDGEATRRHRISSPPRQQDFAALTIPDVDLKALRDCRPGDCALKLTEPMLQRVRAIDWSSPAAATDAQALVRAMALSLVSAYKNGGDGALGTDIDEAPSVSVGRETADLIREMPLLNDGLRQYLLAYPHGSLPNAMSSFAWEMSQFGLKPTFRINQVVTVAAPDHGIVVSKQLYASHYIRAAVDVREMIPDRARGRGYWLVEVSVARVDGLTGVRGHFIRDRATSQGTARLARTLQATKARLESSTSTH